MTDKTFHCWIQEIFFSLLFYQIELDLNQAFEERMKNSSFHACLNLLIQVSRKLMIDFLVSIMNSVFTFKSTLTCQIFCLNWNTLNITGLKHGNFGFQNSKIWIDYNHWKIHDKKDSGRIYETILFKST